MNKLRRSCGGKQDVSLISLSDNSFLLAHGILVFLDKILDLPSLAATCRKLKDLIYSTEFSFLWNISPTDICIDDNCFGCGRVSLPFSQACRIIKNAPINHLRMHLSFMKLGYIVDSILSKGTIQTLHLRFRFDSQAFSKRNYLLPRTYQTSSVTHLIIFGWPNIDLELEQNLTEKLVHICLAFLNVVGNNLVSLHFMETSPAYLLEAVATKCPKLTCLTIEGTQTQCPVLNFESDNLKILCLRDTDIQFHGPLRLPNLKRLEYLDRNNLSKSASVALIEQAINSIPESVRELEIRVNSLFANAFLYCVSRRLHGLESLAIQMPDSSNELPPDITRQSLQCIREGCPQLLCLEVTDGFIAISTDAITVLGTFPKLRRIKLFYDENIIHHLVEILNESKSIEEVTLLENASELYSESGGPESWNEMEEALKEIGKAFPNVSLNLADCWWV